jgi:hypothetical protein
LVILFLIGCFLFNALFSPLISIIRPNMRIYFALRVRGESHECAMRRVIETRYPFSQKKTDYAKRNILNRISRDQSEKEQLKALVYMILCYEHRTPPTMHMSEEIQRQIDDIYDSLSKKYGFKENDIDLRKHAQSHL